MTLGIFCSLFEWIWVCFQLYSYLGLIADEFRIQMTMKNLKIAKHKEEVNIIHGIKKLLISEKNIIPVMIRGLFPNHLDLFPIRLVLSNMISNRNEVFHAEIFVFSALDILSVFMRRCPICKTLSASQEQKFVEFWKKFSAIRNVILLLRLFII